MSDERLHALARLLVGYSTEVKAGEVCVIFADSPAERLALAIHEEVLRAGGLPTVTLQMEGEEAAVMRLGTDEQLDWIPPSRGLSREASVQFRLMAAADTGAYSDVDPARLARRQRAILPMMETAAKRSAAGELRSCWTLFPTEAYAVDAGMSLVDYQDLFYRACLCDRPDPASEWRIKSAELRRLAEWMSGKEQIHVEGPGVDLSLNVSGRTFVVGDGAKNMPDGEVFTGPIEDSASGEVRFTKLANFGGPEVAGVRLRFELGRVVDASAEQNEALLIEMLDSDEGARRLGELGIGANYDIDRFTGQILLDEKIGGTVHLALGRSYPETGGRNESGIHWDMICDLRRGGRLEVDGVDLLADGKLTI